MVKKISCLVIAIMLMLTCVGCGTTAEIAQDKEEQQSMFVLVESNAFRGVFLQHCLS